MSIETRHYAWCSLGPLAAPPAGATTLVDDHVQRKGVVTTRGTVVLQGMHHPAAGTAVSLAYGNGMWIARVPRRLRVLSSFADPLRGVTTVSVGCLFAYHENRKPPVENPKEAEQNSTLGSIFAISGGNSQVTHNDSVYSSIRKVAALPMRASLVIGTIFDTLGLVAAGSVPFEIYRVVDEWNLSAGYVEELDRIVSSAGYFCRIDDNEQVEFINKGQELGEGSLVLGSRIIDMQPINVGNLPGDVVYAKYSATKLVNPVSAIISGENGEEQQQPLDENEQKRRNWEWEKTDGGAIQVVHTYTNPDGTTEKEYAAFVDYSFSETKYDSEDRVVSRKEVKNGPTGENRTITKTFYDLRKSTSPREQVTEEYSPVANVASSCGFEGNLSQLKSLGSHLSRKVFITYEKDESTGNTLTKTSQYLQYVNTPFGSDIISRLREEIDSTDNQAIQRLIQDASELVPYGGKVQIRTERNFGAQTRPSQQQRNKEALRKNNKSSTESTEQEARFVWAMGSSASQTAIELSPPYVSDEYTIVGGTVTVPRYSTSRGNADQQALRYARIENRLLLGNRNGAGIQLAPIDMPAKPFALFYIRANGTTGAYRTNGTTWTITANGNIVCSTDALFWGAVDGDIESAFFTLPPGITTLPSEVVATVNANPAPANAIAPPAGFNPVDPNLVALFNALPTTQAAIPLATISPVQIVTPWNETLQVAAGVQVGAVATVQRWLPTVVTAAAGVRVGAVSSVPNIAIGTGEIGAVGYSVTLEVSAFGGEMALGTAEAGAEAFPVEIEQESGPITGDVELQIIPALAEARAVSVNASTGFESDIITTTSSAIASATGYPVDIVATDPPFWAETQLLLPMSGANNSTVFTDLSKYNRTVEVFGNTKILTDLGDPAGFFDGNGDYLDVNIPVMGTSDYTIEMFIRPSNLTYDTDRTLMYIGSFSPFGYAGLLTQGGVTVYFTGDSTIRFGPATGAGSDGMIANTWYHVALCKTGNTARLFLNGALSFFSVSTNEGNNWSSGKIRIGGWNGQSYHYIGHMKWFRLTYAARYTQPFTPPAALEPYS